MRWYQDELNLVEFSNAASGLTIEHGGCKAKLISWPRGRCLIDLCIQVGQAEEGRARGDDRAAPRQLERPLHLVLLSKKYEAPCHTLVFRQFR